MRSTRSISYIIFPNQVIFSVLTGPFAGTDRFCPTSPHYRGSQGIISTRCVAATGANWTPSPTCLSSLRSLPPSAGNAQNLRLLSSTLIPISTWMHRVSLASLAVRRQSLRCLQFTFMSTGSGWGGTTLLVHTSLPNDMADSPGRDSLKVFALTPPHSSSWMG